jgi:hypothetical protein
MHLKPGGVLEEEEGKKEREEEGELNCGSRCRNKVIDEYQVQWRAVATTNHARLLCCHVGSDRT